MVKVLPYSDFPDRVNLLKQVELCYESSVEYWEVEKTAVYGRFWLIKFKGIDSREDAYSLKDKTLQIPLDERIPLSVDQYYHDQLVDLLVYDSQQQLLGKVVKITPTGGHDQLLVELTASGKVIMIPAVKAFIKDVNLSSGTIRVELPDGLLDL